MKRYILVTWTIATDRTTNALVLQDQKYMLGKKLKTTTTNQTKQNRKIVDNVKII